MQGLSTEEAVAQIHVMVEGLYKSIIPEIQERMGRHSLEASNGMREVRAEIKNVNEKLRELIDEGHDSINDLDKRVVRLETEKKVVLGVITPAISAAVSAGIAWVMGK